MTSTRTSLELTQQQLCTVERALEALRREVLPGNEERYRMMAEPYLEQISKLRGEIDSLLGIKELLAP